MRTVDGQRWTVDGNNVRVCRPPSTVHRQPYKLCQTYTAYGDCSPLLLLAACGLLEETEPDKGVLLAEAHNQKLYLSELDGMIPAEATPADSVVIASAYTERWIRSSLLMQEAEKHIPKDLNIDKLVRDYRSSLIRYSYEQQLVEQELDSLISKRELNEFYEKNQDQYQLESPILRCNFIKVPQSAPQLKKLRTLWQSDSIPDRDTLLAYCNQHAEEFLLSDSIWYKVEDIAARLPKGTITADNINKTQELTLSENDFLYLLRVVEIINRKEIAPLAYIEDQAAKVILHRRKIKLLEEHREELYEQEVAENNVKVYPLK